MKQKVILLGLNELNFDYIEAYVNKGHLPNFKSLYEQNGFCQTTSENTYELLEPWIQWVSLHTGKTYAEHQVFSLGDIVDRKDLVQLWEIAESKGLKVGAISPFNARNNLKNGSFFCLIHGRKQQQAAIKFYIECRQPFPVQLIIMPIVK